MKNKIYVIDDEPDILDIVRINLQEEGYDIRCFQTGEDALRKIGDDVPDLIILDIMMPGMDGYEICRRIRSSDVYRTIPIIFLSAKSNEIDKILGLELGGDDYITKPFSVKELQSRVKAILRRTSRPEIPLASHQTIVHEGMELDPDHYNLRIDGTNVDLTKTEFGLLRLFLSNPGKVFTRDNIINSIKGHDEYVIDRTIDVHIMNLRKKLGKYKDVIKTISGVGYGYKKYPVTAIHV